MGYGMKPGSKEKDTPTGFSEKQANTIGKTTVGKLSDNKPKKLAKRQGTLDTKDAGVTYYGSKEELATYDGPSENQPSFTGRVFASSHKSGGKTRPSTQSFKEAREREKMEDLYDRTQARKRGVQGPDYDRERSAIKKRELKKEADSKRFGIRYGLRPEKTGKRKK